MSDAPSGASGNYRVLARKYRPATFADLIGQEAMVRTLSNAFAANRIAQGYMLTGLRGIGKTTTARLIARALNYGDQPTIDMGEITEQCRAILEGHHVDVMEMDAASNTGVDNMREIIESVRYRPVSARYKVYIIDEVHMLSKSAFNALLKTLEEPPPHVKFIFATTEIRQVPVTILSRCQRFDLRRIPVARLGQHLETIAGLEQVPVDMDALQMIARVAEGSVRDSLSLLDQAIAYGNGSVRSDDVRTMLGLADRARVIELFEALMQGDAGAALGHLQAHYQAGAEPHAVLSDMARFIHWVTRLKLARASALEDVQSTETERLRGIALADTLSLAHLSRAWSMLLRGLAEVAASAEPLAAAEMVLVRMAHAADLPSGEDLLKLARTALVPGISHQAAAGSASISASSGSVSAMAPRALSAPGAGLSGMENSISSNPSPQAGGAARMGLNPQANPVPEAVNAPVLPPLDTLESIAAFLAEKRDIKLKSDLERFVRPVRITPGQMEIALEAGAPTTLPNELSRKLEALTGRRWMVMVASEGGEPTLAARRAQAADARLQAVLANPDIQAILGAFPGAHITSIKPPDTPIADPELLTDMPDDPPDDINEEDTP